MSRFIAIQRGILGVIVFALCGVTSAVTANDTTDVQTTPHEVVEQVTSELIKVTSVGKTALAENPEKYYSDVRGIMETAVDFKHIARNVMGRKYWRAATLEQKKQFVEVFTSGLVETYAKGMANFAGFEVSVMDPTEPLADKSKVVVIQKFKGADGVNRVGYTMIKNKKTGNWKLINVVLDGVNLGKTLRSQFSQTVTDSEGDLDAAIKSWTFSS